MPRNWPQEPEYEDPQEYEVENAFAAAAREAGFSRGQNSNRQFSRPEPEQRAAREASASPEPSYEMAPDIPLHQLLRQRDAAAGGGSFAEKLVAAPLSRGKATRPRPAGKPNRVSLVERQSTHAKQRQQPNTARGPRQQKQPARRAPNTARGSRGLPDADPDDAVGWQGEEVNYEQTMEEREAAWKRSLEDQYAKQEAAIRNQVSALLLWHLLSIQALAVVSGGWW